MKGSSRWEGDVGGGGCEVECRDSCCGRSGHWRRDTVHVVENGHQSVGHQRMDTNGTPASCTTSWRTHVLGSDMAIGGVLIVQWSRPASRPACFDPVDLRTQGCGRVSGHWVEDAGWQQFLDMKLTDKYPE